MRTRTSGRGKRLLAFSMLPVAAAVAQALAADLPVPCIAGACGASVTSFVSSGIASTVNTGTLLRIDQQTDKAILNWASFDVAPGNRVQFVQPGANSIALNRIFQESPSVIRGAIDANGQVYLVNANGLIFGAGARVRSAGLVASTLPISDANFAAGLLSPELLQNSRPALESDGRLSVVDANGQPVLGADGEPLQVRLLVEAGAELSTVGSGGRLLLAGQTVENSGRLTAAEGQVVLAAGEKVYLQASADPALRGLVVEVDQGGTAWNRLAGEITTREGNTTLVGLAVNQDGRISATTSVASNGSIRLLARDTAQIALTSAGAQLSALSGGTLTVGEGSRMAILPELTDTATAVNDQAQLPSTIDLSGRQVFVQADAQLVAPGGLIRATAQQTPTGAGNYDPLSRLRINERALLDVSGTDATAPVTRNLVTVELRANELKDSPVQRDGVLRGKAVVVDAREGTPLADVSGAIATIQRGIGERTSAGGSITLASDGDVVVAKDATLDVSGGTVTYTPGIIQTTQLLTANGRIVDIGDANPDVVYSGLINPTLRRRFDRWGVEETITGPSIGRLDPGYTDGSAGGSLRIIAPSLSLAGRFRGTTFTGELQRNPALAATGALFGIGLPGGGSLAEGIPDYRAPSISLVDSILPLSVGNDAALPVPRVTELSVDFLTAGGFERTEILSNGVISLDTATPLQLASGASLRLLGHRVDIRSDIIAPSGTLVFDAVLTSGIAGATLPRPGVQIAEGVLLDVRGGWYNDALDLQAGASTRDLAPLFIDGGFIEAATASIDTELDIGRRVRLLADGGGWRDSTGAVRGGRGGGISLLAAGERNALSIGEDVGMSALGSANAAGGRFAFAAPRVAVVDADEWAVTRTFDPVVEPGPGTRSVFELGSALFEDFGFASFDIAATGGARNVDEPVALSIDPGVSIAPRVRTRLIDGDAAVAAATGSDIAGFGRNTTLFPVFEQAADLTFRVAPNVLFTDFDRIGVLEMGAGAAIIAPARSQVSLLSPGGIDMGGTILAAGGHVTLGIPTPEENVDGPYRPNLLLSVRDGTRIDVSGTALYRPNELGLRVGEVLAGGEIDLIADRGGLSVARGAYLTADGGAAELDIVDPLRQDQGFRATPVATPAGTILLRAPESLLFAGRLSAQSASGVAGAAAGGTLRVQLTRDRGWNGGFRSSSYPTTPRVLALGSSPAVGDGAPPSGTGYFDLRTLASSGIDALTVEAGDRVAFESGTDLALARSLSIDAPVIEVQGGGDVRVAAPYVEIGRTLLQPASVAAESGTGRFTADGQLVDVIGTAAFAGVRDVAIRSAGDLRLRGAEVFGTSRGSLLVDGNLTLGGRRIFAPSATTFDVRVSDTVGDTGLLWLQSSGTSQGTPLSAGSQLALAATDIRQDAALYAPFGSLRLDGSASVSFGAGSLTSVSGDGLTIPWGRVNVGSWEYVLGGVVIPQTAIPGRRIDIASPVVDSAATSTIDLRGGGDLYAYEWTPGTGGTTDALSTANPNLFAILPSMRGQGGVYDQQEAAGSVLSAGESLQVDGSSLLPAGVYPLLPARYALLPGAVLVEAKPQYRLLAPGVSTTTPDGAIVVAGRRVKLDTGIGDAQYTGFALRPGSFGRSLATYGDFLASSFFPARAARLDLPEPVRTVDAGSIGFDIDERFDVRGTLRTAGSGAGRSANIDFSAPRLEILTGGATASAGAVGLSAAALSAWNPGSVFLGGLRNAANDQFRVTADTVLLGTGARLAFDEALVAARESVTVAADATLVSRATASRLDVDAERATVTLTGDGAATASAVGVSDLRRLAIGRSGSAAASGGVVDVADGGTLRSASSLVLAAPGGTTLAGVVEGSGAHWDLSANRIAFADAERAGELALDGQVVTAANAARTLRLASDTSIDLYRSVSLGGAGVQSPLRELTLKAGALRAQAPDVQAQFGALDELRLEGSATAVPASPSTGSGNLSVTAQRVYVGPGDLSIQRFNRTDLVANDAVIGEGNGRLTADAALFATTPRVTVENGATTTIASLAAATFQRPTGLPTSVDTQPGIGGAITVEAPTITVSGTQFVAPTGSIALDAGTSLAMGSGSTLDVSGRLVQVLDRQLASGGGRIRLSSGDRIDVDAATLLDVTGINEEAAGQVTVRAAGAANLAGGLQGRSGTGRGGSFVADVGSLADFGSLNRRLESAGFAGTRDVTVATGDLVVAASDAVTAESLRLSAAGGRVRVDGAVTLESADARPELGLYGAQGVAVGSTARIEAVGVGPESRGGVVTLATSAGRLDVSSGATIATGGALENGRVLLRAPIDGTDVAIDRIDAQLSDVREVIVEPFLDVAASGTVNAATLAAPLQQLADFNAANAGTILSRLAAAQAIPLRLAPGLQISAAGDLTLQRLDLNELWTAADPLNLAFRAGGTISLQGTVSSGFTTGGTTQRPRVDMPFVPSGNLSFAAGSRLAGADPLAVGAGFADVRFANNVVARTATGDLGIAAARDIVFGTRASAYTAGLQALPTEELSNGPSYGFAAGGGQLSLLAGRDVVGSPVTQSVGDWQPRAGRPATATGDAIAMRWGIDVGRFGWNAGTLGGGDLTVRAGRDVLNLSAAAADSGAELPDGTISLFRGGVLELDAGRNVGSLFAHMTRGTNLLRAGDAFTRQRPATSGEALGSVLSMQDASALLRARSGVALESVFNPTVLSQVGTTTATRSFFFTYGEDGRLDIQSAAGDLSLQFQGNRMASFLAQNVVAAQPSNFLLTIFPASLSLQALSGDFRLDAPIFLFASDRGQLDVAVAGDINQITGGITMSDAVAEALPTPSAPVTSMQAAIQATLRSASSARHAGDERPAEITAGGDITGGLIASAKPLRVRAGRDIVDATLIAQNLGDKDVTQVAAGRDLLYTVRATTGRVEVGGPGSAVITAGRDIDLGFSQGVITTGALVNGQLPAGDGADISLIAGLAQRLDVAAFLSRIVEPSAALRKRLIDYVAARSGEPVPSFDAARTGFLALDEPARLPLLSELFFNELVQAGRERNLDPTSNYERGYAAIDALFKDSRPAENSGAVNPFAGDVRLAFSRIYSLDGGTISIFAPGGLLNVGLANPPANLPVQRLPSDLGIVAQGKGDVRIFTEDDVLVNQSRVFTLGGGDIAVWSTLGDIDAGRGSKSSISAPPPRVVIDAQGNVRVDLGAAVAGSGIRTIVTGEGIEAGDVDLIAPAGTVNAGDAGIGSAGNLNVAAQQVAGLDNIQVGGSSTGVPAETSNLGASLSGASASGASATNTSTGSVEGGRGEEAKAAPLAQSALSWLDVFVEGFGDDVCKPSDEECLRRNREAAAP